VSTPIVAIDVETTGFDVTKHEILEIGLVWATPDLEHIMAQLGFRVAPECISTANWGALNICGYDPKVWESAVSQEAAAQWAAAFCRGSVPLGYNVSFDLRFLNTLFGRFNIYRPWAGEWSIDVMKRSSKLKKEGWIKDRKLASVARYFGLTQPKPHRALDDALLALRIERTCKKPPRRAYQEHNTEDKATA
jgi:CRISPR-associated protein Cas2